MGRRISAAGLADAGANVAMSVLYGAFAAAHVQSYVARPRASLVLLVALESVAAAFFLMRRSARSTSLNAWSFVTTAIGTLLPLLLRPTGATRDAVAGQVIQAAGIAMGLAAFASLNRSIGLLPANRGIRTGGAYRLVRHPLYAAYTVMNVGYLVSNFAAWNLIIVLGALAAQLLRMRVEEDFLSTDPEYAAYTRRTRWRLLPFVF